MKKTPYMVKVYILLAVVIICLPTFGTKFYEGQTGRFMVAGEVIQGEPFRESVVYIIHHNLIGAHGVIINKPVDPDRLRRYMEHSLGEDVPLRLGGPVQFSSHISALVAENSSDVIYIYEEDLLLDDLDDRTQGYSYRQIYIGYSGWWPLQLEFEILKGRWSIVKESPALVFDRQNKDMWWELYSRGSGDPLQDKVI